MGVIYGWSLLRVCLLQGCLLKGLSFIWVTDIGMSVKGVFYRGVDLVVSIIRDVYLKGVSIIGGVSIKKTNVSIWRSLLFGVSI